jgi:hypothetical protein
VPVISHQIIKRLPTFSGLGIRRMAEKNQKQVGKGIRSMFAKLLALAYLVGDLALSRHHDTAGLVK